MAPNPLDLELPEMTMKFAYICVLACVLAVAGCLGGSSYGVDSGWAVYVPPEGGGDSSAALRDSGAAGDGDGITEDDGGAPVGDGDAIVDAGVELPPSDAGAAPELCDCSLERGRSEIPTHDRNGLQLPRCMDRRYLEGTGYHCDGTYCRPTVVETVCPGTARCFMSTGCE